MGWQEWNEFLMIAWHQTLPLHVLSNTCINMFNGIVALNILICLKTFLRSRPMDILLLKCSNRPKVGPNPLIYANAWLIWCVVVLSITIGGSYCCRVTCVVGVAAKINVNPTKSRWRASRVKLNQWFLEILMLGMALKLIYGLSGSSNKSLTFISV